MDDIPKIVRCIDCHWAHQGRWHLDKPAHGCQNPLVNKDSPEWLGGRKGEGFVEARRPDPPMWRQKVPAWTGLRRTPSACGLEGKQFLSADMTELCTPAADKQKQIDVLQDYPRSIFGRLSSQHELANATQISDDFVVRQGTGK